MPAKLPKPALTMRRLVSTQIPGDPQTSRALAQVNQAITAIQAQTNPSVTLTSDLPATSSITISHGLGQMASHIDVSFTDTPVSGYGWSWQNKNANQIIITTTGSARKGAVIKVT